MSSERADTNCSVECPRFSGEGLTTQSKSGPKLRSKDVSDGKLVDIPVPDIYDKESKRGRRRIARPRGWRAVAKSRVRVWSEVHIFRKTSDDGE